MTDVSNVLSTYLSTVKGNLSDKYSRAFIKFRTTTKSGTSYKYVQEVF